MDWGWYSVGAWPYILVEVPGATQRRRSFPLVGSYTVPRRRRHHQLMHLKGRYFNKYFVGNRRMSHHSSDPEHCKTRHWFSHSSVQLYVGWSRAVDSSGIVLQPCNRMSAACFPRCPQSLRYFDRALEGPVYQSSRFFILISSLSTLSWHFCSSPGDPMHLIHRLNWGMISAQSNLSLLSVRKIISKTELGK